MGSSVGATATMVASARAITHRADNPLINDPFAEPLVRAIDVDVLTKPAGGEMLPADLAPAEDFVGATAAKPPTAWSAEDLPSYLPPEAQDRLLDTVAKLSATGSRLATESVRNLEQTDGERLEERVPRISERWQAHGFDLDMTRLRYIDDHNEAAAYLSDHGWLLTSVSLADLVAANALPPVGRRLHTQAQLLLSECHAVYNNQTGAIGMTHSRRSDGDTWGPASNVGATATMIAALRALTSHGPEALLDDQLATRWHGRWV